MDKTIRLVVHRSCLSFSTHWPLASFAYQFATGAELDEKVATYRTKAEAAGYKVELVAA